MSVRRLPGPLVHADWTLPWWQADPVLVSLFGPAPSEASLGAVAETLTAQPRPDPPASVGVPPIPRDALVVLAGQQPVLAGGPLLVAHKAATAIALARQLAHLWQRPVVPVFLLATQDHDSDEIDHVDIINPLNKHLLRLRCPLSDRNELFSRCSWNEPPLRDAVDQIAGSSTLVDGVLSRNGLSSLPETPLSAHVSVLLQDVFAAQGLIVVEAHRLEPWGRALLLAALTEPAPLRGALRDGADGLARAGLRTSFDAEDIRPLVMESRQGRRRRVAAGDLSALDRFRDQPADFSPAAALRPIVQAAALRVVAQVCGPSELLYLAQARGLHGYFDVTPPVLVPRLEATRIPREDLARQEGGLESFDLSATARPSMDEERDLAVAARRFVDAVVEQDHGLAGRARRWLNTTEKAARRLAEATAWRSAQTSPALRPRGRYQDAVLAWLPEALGLASPTAWVEHIVGLCRPLDPPAHVLHTFGPEIPHG